MAIYRLTTLAKMPNGEPFVTTCHFLNAESSPADVQALVNSIGGSWATAYNGSVTYRGLFSPNFVWQGLRLHRIDPTTGAITAVAEYSFSGLSANTASGTDLPAQNAIVVSLRTATPGRRGRGRMYFGGFTSAAVAAGGVVGSGTQTALRDFVNACYSAPLNSAPFNLADLVVYSRVGRSTSTVTSIRVGSGFDVQRRRANRRVETYSSVTPT